MKVTQYNAAVADIRATALAILDIPESISRGLIEVGVPAAAVAKLPPILKPPTVARLQELVDRAPIEVRRDRNFLVGAVQEAERAKADLCSAWDACVKAQKIWDDLVASGDVKYVDRDGNPIGVTAYDKAVEAQQARQRLKVVTDNPAPAIATTENQHMFALTMPLDFKIGDTSDCSINGEPARVTWRNERTLVIGSDDVCQIFHATADDELRTFFCGDPGAKRASFDSVLGGGAQDLLAQAPAKAFEGLYWIAVNGASVALSPAPLRQPQVLPVPEQMWGFPTLDEAKRAQTICLTAPIEETMAYLKSLAPDIRCGRVRYVRPERPEPPTGGETVWFDNASGGTTDV